MPPATLQLGDSGAVASREAQEGQAMQLHGQEVNEKAEVQVPRRAALGLSSCLPCTVGQSAWLVVRKVLCLFRHSVLEATLLGTHQMRRGE